MSDYTLSEKFVQQLMAKLVGELNLISREELEVQNQVLLRTRQRVEELEQKIKELGGSI